MTRHLAAAIALGTVLATSGCTEQAPTNADAGARPAAPTIVADAPNAAGDADAPSTAGQGAPLLYDPDPDEFARSREALRAEGGCAQHTTAPLVEILGDLEAATLTEVQQAVVEGDVDAIDAAASQLEAPDLVLAAAAGCAELVAAMLGHGLPADAALSDQGYLALDRAIRAGNPAVVDALIDAGADATHRNVEGTSLLHHAVGRGDLRIVELLLDAGADATAVTDYDESTLGLATGDDAPEILLTLLDAGATPRPDDLLVHARRVPPTGAVDPLRTRAAVAVLLDRGLRIDDTTRGTSLRDLLTADGHADAVTFIDHYEEWLESR